MARTMRMVSLRNLKSFPTKGAAGRPPCSAGAAASTPSSAASSPSRSSATPSTGAPAAGPHEDEESEEHAREARGPATAGGGCDRSKGSADDEGLR